MACFISSQTTSGWPSNAQLSVFPPATSTWISRNSIILCQKPVQDLIDSLAVIGLRKAGNYQKNGSGSPILRCLVSPVHQSVGFQTVTLRGLRSGFLRPWHCVTELFSLLRFLRYILLIVLTSFYMRMHHIKDKRPISTLEWA